ncbi:ankyrin repeat domain-containing protein [Luteimonas granuli]|uniref:Ankyrin repeat domain-containing protein n=1 Tax=Luteimonas granuli TaxID=1176533 RepID=A0A518N2K0_9GAMM|nr:ankyrin repeat domain-containing protein [Luteimonas granuli]QDW66161.1 ankyrin repeat domain-containing protein [Luteimonas granuli]
MRTCRVLPLALLLSASAAGLLLSGCGNREVSRMDLELAGRAFPDDARMAEIAVMARAGDVVAVRRLAPWVDLDARGDRQVTLLEWAILADSHAGFEALLDAGADPHVNGMDGESAIHLAARVHDSRFLATLIARGADLDTPALHGHGPLTSAIREGNDAHIALLLRAGANPDQADGTGNTPLHVAAKIGTPGHALLLLEGGADPGARNGRGHTFDRYLFAGPERFLNQAAREDIARIRRLLDDGSGGSPE